MPFLSPTSLDVIHWTAPYHKNPHETPEGRAPLSLYTGSPAPVATKK